MPLQSSVRFAPVTSGVVFSPEERARIRDALLARAREDERIVGAAFTGSFARDADGIIGLALHPVRHARMSIERGKAWQAEYWIGELRHHALMLACLRHALPARYARGIDDLPPEVTRPFEDAFARSLERDELC